jgi:hypothetical protein
MLLFLSSVDNSDKFLIDHLEECTVFYLKNFLYAQKGLESTAVQIFAEGEELCDTFSISNVMVLRYSVSAAVIGGKGGIRMLSYFNRRLFVAFQVSEHNFVV